MESWFPTFQQFLDPQNSYFCMWPWHTTFGQRQALMRLIAVSSEEHLPLYPLIEAWANDERGIQQRRLHRLARLLNQGTPLAEAVEQIPRVLRKEDILAIRFDTQSGTLPATVRAMLDPSQFAPMNPLYSLRKTFVYFGAVIFMAVLIVTFVQIKIFPAFIKIFSDFDTQLPEVFLSSVRLSYAVVNYWWPGVFVVLIFCLFAVSTRLGRLVGRTIFHRLFRPIGELRAADVLQKLSIATAAGRPVSGVFSTLARYHFDPTIRHKLLFVRNEVEQGANAWQSMATIGLLTPPEERVLNTSERVGNRPWALSELAIGKRRQAIRTLERMKDLFLPFMVILMGGFVLFQALTVFMPLIKLVLSLV